MTSLDGGISLEVDVLVIGGGLAALSIARELQRTHSVCVVVEPHVVYETYESNACFGAGYGGNDLVRIQAARRAAGYWHLWAESNNVPHDFSARLHLLGPEEERVRTRLWADAGLASSPVAPRWLPPVLVAGAAVGRPLYVTENDVVMDPVRVAAELRAGLEDRLLAGTILRFGQIADAGIHYVQVELPDGRTAAITPGAVVLAADAANGTLLHKLVPTISSRARRREAVEVLRTCQAVRRRTTIVVRGDLPLLSGNFDGTDIVALPVDGDGGGTHGEGTEPAVWIVQPPVDDTLTVVGPDDVRRPPKLDLTEAAATIDRLFELCPEVRKRARKLSWGAFVARRTQHPASAALDRSLVAEPVPAKLETFGVPGFVAAWPSHLAYNSLISDHVTERVRQSLPTGGVRPDDAALAAMPRPAPEAFLARWDRPDFVWHDWSALTDWLGARAA
jgi:glycine/D-amino acid oxidase-like deaminating enzyme